MHMIFSIGFYSETHHKNLPCLEETCPVDLWNLWLTYQTNHKARSLEYALGEESKIRSNKVYFYNNLYWKNLEANVYHLRKI